MATTPSEAADNQSPAQADDGPMHGRAVAAVVAGTVKAGTAGVVAEAVMATAASAKRKMTASSKSWCTSTRVSKTVKGGKRFGFAALVVGR